MNLVRPSRPVAARVVSNELCMQGKSASFVKHLVIDVGDTPLAGAVLPGQSFGVIPPGRDADSKPHKVRLYSSASPSWGEDGVACHLATTPKRLIDEYRPRPDDDPDDHRLFLGVCSNYLCDLKPGDRINVSGPNGRRFLLPEDPAAHDYLFLATGTGIAPFRGMLLELLESPRGPCRSRIDLVMGSPYTTDLLYDDLFRDLSARHPNFRYHTAISREPEGRGRYVADCLRAAHDHFGALLAGGRTRMYLCGVIGMQTDVFRLLGELGLAAGYLRLSDRLLGAPPTQWSDADLARHAKPTERCRLELY